MSINRRKFVKYSIIGASAAASPGIFFPKPAESINLNFLIRDATSRTIFTRLIAYAGVKIINAVFTPRPTTQQAIANANGALSNNGFNSGETQKGRPSNRSLLWGKEKQELDPLIQSNIPNPGFAFVDESDGYPSSSIFTASTAVGISQASKVLREEHKLSPRDVADILLPTQERFEDITTWQGDQDQAVGFNPNVGLTNYGSRGGQVTRRYERVSEQKGIITMYIESPSYNGKIITNVDFTT